MLFRCTLLAPLALFSLTAFAQDAATYTGSWHVTAVPHLGHPVQAAPYSAEETTERVQTLADGTRITHTEASVKYYRDAAGRTRVERPLPKARSAETTPLLVEITDPVAGFRYTLDTVNHVAHRQALDAAPPQPTTRAHSTPMRPAPQLMNDTPREGPKTTTEKLDSQTMEGLLVTGTRRTTVIPAGSQDNDHEITVVSEEWRSAELRLTVLRTTNDPRSGESTTKLQNVTRDEPDASLFQPPADYTVVDEKGDFTLKWGAAQ